ncbi:TonB-dependent receptor [Bowmanella dokdonensis]|uniref:TonB-dependent receptor n=1 Tax=Bowmanella dokdonensis TaxID=751969 RepID=A0A939ISP3_9ALTE|nr:TonB-dependent receptor [Bowmanella dokdonensis]MBN7827399.1 TonB-dependent receptor [Bowmanella dokdonensis]
MFKPTYLASAIVLALSSQLALAQETDDDQNEQSADGVEVIQVSGIRASMNQALNVKRFNNQIIDAIVAEDIGKFPDNNVVESLQRVTGVQVTDRGAGEVSTVSIRGLPDVTTTINGRNIFTAAGTAVALADIPASLLKQVDVYKTRSASHIESGIAGAIDVKTHRPFDFEEDKFIVAARGIYNEQNEEVNPAISALASKQWELDAGRLGALINLSYNRMRYRDQSITAGAMVPFLTENGAPGLGPYERLFSGWQAGLLDGLPTDPDATLNINGEDVGYILGRDAVFQSDFNGERERPAANISIQFAPNDTSEYLFEAFYNGYRNEGFNSLFFSFADWWGHYNGMTPEQAQAAANVSLFPGTNIVQSRSVRDPWVFTSGDLSTGKTDSYLYALGGNWELSPDLSLKSEIVYQDSEFTSDFFAMRFIRPGNSHQIDVAFNGGAGYPEFSFVDNPATELDESDMADPSHYITDTLYDNANRDKGDALTFTADLTWRTDSFFTAIDTGIRYDKRGAQTAFSRQDGCGGCGTNVATLDGLASINSGFFDGRADVPTSWAVANGYTIRNNADTYRDLYGMQQLSLQDSFDIDATTLSVYLQGRFETRLAGRTLDGEVGLRYTGIDTDSLFSQEVAPGQDQPVTAGESKTRKILPSVMVRYALTEDVLARLSYTETLRYPSFGDLNPLIVYNEDVTGIGYGTANGGNPDLKPTESKNYDFSLEWYFGEASSLYGTLFKRNVDGFVVPFRRSVTHDKSATDPTPYKFILSQPFNASDGELSGAELGLVWFPENLPGPLDGFGVQASYTKLSSSQSTPVTNELGEVVEIKETDLFGVSDSSYSVVLAYDKGDLNVRWSYAWRKEFLSDYEAPLFANPLERWRTPEKSMDFQLSYRINDNLEVTFDGTNLTDELYQSYYGAGNQVTHNFGTALYSRTFALGVRYSM